MADYDEDCNDKKPEGCACEECCKTGPPIDLLAEVEKMEDEKLKCFEEKHKIFKRDYPWTYKTIMSGDKDEIIEQVALIYSQKDRIRNDRSKKIGSKYLPEVLKKEAENGKTQN